ncbi:MAG: hypothetical protein PHE55_17320, partial [Methylococcaceae bacterium]|nr:hypothetical protein [Methylococcaceae bacterium]
KGGISALPANIVNDNKLSVRELSPGIGDDSPPRPPGREENPLPTLGNRVLEREPGDVSFGEWGGETMLEQISRLETANAELTLGKGQDAKKIERLEEKVIELNALLQEQRERHSGMEAGDELKALQSELEKLRIQAVVDASAAQTRLRISDQELARLRKRFRPIETVIFSVLMMAVGALLLFVLLRGTDIGREFIRALANQ